MNTPQPQPFADVDTLPRAKGHTSPDAWFRLGFAVAVTLPVCSVGPPSTCLGLQTPIRGMRDSVTLGRSIQSNGNTRGISFSKP